jgi:hypothetical protein
VIEPSEPVDTSTPPHLATTWQRLAELAALPPDWDSYGGDPPTTRAIVTARQLVAAIAERANDRPADAAPWFIAPVPDGGVQLEWRGPARELTVTVGPNGSLGYLIAAREAHGEAVHEAAEVDERRIVELVARTVER